MKRFLLLLPGTAFSTGVHSLKGGCRRHLYGVFRRLGSNEQSVKKTYLKNPPPSPRRDASGCRLHPILKNITSHRSAGSAVPAHETQPTKRSTRPDWAERHRTLLSLDRTPQNPSLIGQNLTHSLSCWWQVSASSVHIPQGILANLLSSIMTMCKSWAVKVKKNIGKLWSLVAEDFENNHASFKISSRHVCRCIKWSALNNILCMYYPQQNSITWLYNKNKNYPDESRIYEYSHIFQSKCLTVTRCLLHFCADSQSSGGK